MKLSSILVSSTTPIMNFYSPAMKAKKTGENTNSDSKLIDNYLQSTAVVNAAAVKRVDKAQKADIAYKNNLRTMIQNNESVMLAIAPRTFTAVDLNGDGCSANIVSRSVAKDESRQEFFSNINGNSVCSGHSECDAIIMDKAIVAASPQLTAANIDASLIHEAAIGKIAGEQLIKLMTLGLTEEEAEEQIVNGFLK